MVQGMLIEYRPKFKMLKWSTILWVTGRHVASTFALNDIRHTHVGRYDCNCKRYSVNLIIAVLVMNVSEISLSPYLVK